MSFSWTSFLEVMPPLLKAAVVTVEVSVLPDCGVTTRVGAKFSKNGSMSSASSICGPLTVWYRLAVLAAVVVPLALMASIRPSSTFWRVAALAPSLPTMSPACTV